MSKSRNRSPRRHASPHQAVRTAISEISDDRLSWLEDERVRDVRPLGEPVIGSSPGDCIDLPLIEDAKHAVEGERGFMTSASRRRPRGSSGDRRDASLGDLRQAAAIRLVDVGVDAHDVVQAPARDEVAERRTGGGWSIAAITRGCASSQSSAVLPPSRMPSSKIGSGRSSSITSTRSINARGLSSRKSAPAVECSAARSARSADRRDLTSRNPGTARRSSR